MMTTDHRAAQPNAPVEVGNFRTFGETGPTYQVVERVSDKTVRIEVVESGETLDYPMNQAEEDPLVS